MKTGCYISQTRKNEHENGVGGMVLYKRSGRFCPRIFTLFIVLF
ncbi:hypothetical protein PPSQR21_043210 [Paenibacillus polymyxa SQR-21]|nr:hypothetical protein PPSQR21_043210 [Paenibacillus polymyxa SQR-21]